MAGPCTGDEMCGVEEKCDLDTHLCVPNWIGDIDANINNGEDAQDIADDVQDNLKVPIERLKVTMFKYTNKLLYLHFNVDR